VVPAHLNELSPSEFRGTFPGLTYQLGNLISSSSAQIEAKLGERFTKNGKPDYGLVITVFTLIVIFLLVVLTLFSREYKSIDFIEQAKQSTTNNEKDEVEKQIEKENEKGNAVVETINIE
jgi:SHS family lactate transporter-like MFS transporter